MWPAYRWPAHRLRFPGSLPTMGGAWSIVVKFYTEEAKEKQEVLMGATIETFFQDLRYATRVLRRDPGFTFFAVLTIALSLGANAAIFSLVDGVLLKSVGYP